MLVLCCIPRYASLAERDLAVGDGRTKSKYNSIEIARKFCGKNQRIILSELEAGSSLWNRPFECNLQESSGLHKKKRKYVSAKSLKDLMEMLVEFLPKLGLEIQCSLPNCCVYVFTTTALLNSCQSQKTVASSAGLSFCGPVISEA